MNTRPVEPSCRPRRRLCIAIALATLAFASLAHADAVFDYVDAASGRPQARLFVAGNRVRVDIAYAPGNSYLVIDVDAGTLTQIDPAARALTTTTAEQMQQLLAGIAGAGDPSTQPLMQLALGNLDEATRAQAEAMLRQTRRDAAIPFEKTGAHERIAGIACEVYAQNTGNGERRTLCAAPYAGLGLGQHDAQTLQRAVALLRRTGGPWLPGGDIDGLPLRYAGSFSGAGEGSGVLKTLRQAPQPASRFADPPSYRIVSLFEMMSLLGMP